MSDDQTDELVREFCRENDVGEMKGCPKCAIKGPLAFFCQHKYCPIRDWDHAKGSNPNG